MKTLVFNAAVLVLLFSFSSSEETGNRNFQFVNNLENPTFAELRRKHVSLYAKCDTFNTGRHSDVKFFYNYMNLNISDWEESCVELDANRTENLKAIDPTAPFKFLIHGFTMNGSDKFPLNVIAGYKFRLYDIHRMLEEKKISVLPTPENYNIITVDWSVDSAKYEDCSGINIMRCYRRTKEKVGQIGEKVASFIEMLMQKNLIRSLQDVHIIGFSLGAQIASNIGGILQGRNLEGAELGRITGLDPANPYFLPTEGLHKEDATFVDVIHSSTGDPDSISRLGTGYDNGDIDVYNCARCKNKWAAACRKIENQDDVSSCEHNMATNWFAVSIIDYKDNNFTKATRKEPLFSRLLYLASTPQPKVLFGEFAEKKDAGQYCFCDTESSAKTFNNLIDYHTEVEECMVGWRGTTYLSEHCRELLARWQKYYTNQE